MDDFDKHFSGMKRLMLAAMLVKLTVVGGLIWLAVYAINAFSQ